jgi:hypothetical protein
MQTILDWKTLDSHNWTSFVDLDLQDSRLEGVTGIFFIWSRDLPYPQSIRIGQGNIRDRLIEMRNDPEVMAYQDKHPYVAWCSPPQSQIDGIITFMYQERPPLVPAPYPQAAPIVANTPS